MARYSFPGSFYLCLFVLRFLYIICCFLPHCLHLPCVYIWSPFKSTSVPGGACAVSVITEITPMSSVFLLEITLMDIYTFFIVLLSCLRLLYIMYLLSSGPHGSAVIHFNISKLDKSPCRNIFL